MQNQLRKTGSINLQTPNTRSTKKGWEKHNPKWKPHIHNNRYLETGERRTSRKEDIVKSAIISDATDTVDIYWPMVSSQDHPPHTRHLHDLEASLNNTEKHVTIETTINPKEAKYIIEIATAVVGDEKSLENNP